MANYVKDRLLGKPSREKPNREVSEYELGQIGVES